MPVATRRDCPFRDGGPTRRLPHADRGFCPTLSASRILLVEIIPLGTAIPHGGFLTADRGFCPSWSANTTRRDHPFGDCDPTRRLLHSRPGSRMDVAISHGGWSPAGRRLPSPGVRTGLVNCFARDFRYVFVYFLRCGVRPFFPRLVPLRVASRFGWGNGRVSTEPKTC